MDGKRTSVYLKPDLAARVEASGMRLAAIIERGLDVLEHERLGPTRRTPVASPPDELLTAGPPPSQVQAALPVAGCPHVYPDVRMVAGRRVCRKCPAPLSRGN